MKLLDKLEKRFGNWAVPNVALTLVAAQVFIFGMILIGRVDYGSLLLIPKEVLIKGEWWRVISFLLAPPHVPATLFQTIFLAFFWYIFWMMSSALEAAWSVFRFNVYLFCGLLFTILSAFLGQIVSPGSGIVVSPYFLYLSVFFAFATLHPNVEFLVMFVLPVKVKWMAWLVGAFTALGFLFAPTIGDRIAILGPLLNYFLFCRDAMTHSVQSRVRRSKFDKAKKASANEAFHVCSECGATDQTHPQRRFRYKTVDGAAVCFCEICREKALGIRKPD